MYKKFECIKLQYSSMELNIIEFTQKRNQKCDIFHVSGSFFVMFLTLSALVLWGSYFEATLESRALRRSVITVS